MISLTNFFVDVHESFIVLLIHFSNSFNARSMTFARTRIGY